MKGVIIAGGRGTRLHPLTVAVSKQLLPLYDKPLVYYPLSVLMLAGVREIAVVTTPREVDRFRELLGDGSQWGISLSYVIQPHPAGIANALAEASDFLAGSPAAVVLGDNVLFGRGLGAALKRAIVAHARDGGAMVFLHPVAEPQFYGIVELDTGGRVIGVEEKPAAPRSGLAAIGLYLYDGNAAQLARALEPSPRGEFEITDLNRRYLAAGELRAHRLGRGVRWLDPGTPKELLEAGRIVAEVERRTGRPVGCPEEIALSAGWVSPADTERYLAAIPDGEYALRLRDLLVRHRGRGQ